jgi:serine/threonine-protein kinase RsbW
MKKLYLEIESSRSRIREIEQLMSRANEYFGLSEDEYNRMMIGVTEIAVNAIVHGNKENITKKVRVTVELNDEKMKITIADEGEGFDMEKLPDPTKAENILDIHGRGIYIARNMVDELTYSHIEGRGTEIVMIVKKAGS